MIFSDPRFQVRLGEDAQKLLEDDISQFLAAGGVVTYSCWRSMTQDERLAFLAVNHAADKADEDEKLDEALTRAAVELVDK